MRNTTHLSLKSASDGDQRGHYLHAWSKIQKLYLGICGPIYYEIDKNLIICTPSEGSTHTGFITPVNPVTPELHEVQLPPSSIPEIPALPGITKFTHRTEALRQRVKEHNHWIRELPLNPEERLESNLTRIRSRVDLDEVAFSQDNITYRQHQRIDQATNPGLYTKVSLLEDADYQPPRIEEPEPLGEEEEVEEEEEQCPLQIPDPTGIPSRIQPSELNSPDSLLERLRESLDTHLGTIIDETFQFPKSD